MKDFLITIKLFLFPVFLVLAFFRVVFNNTIIVDYVNLISCSLAISLVYTRTQKLYNKSDKEYSILITAHIINGILLLVLIILEMEFNIIGQRGSDFFSIIAIGASLTQDSLSRSIKCIFKWIKLKNKYTKATYP